MSKYKLINISQLATYNSASDTFESLVGHEVSIDGDTISAVGKNISDQVEEIDCKNKLVIPGFVDPHTHPVFLDGREEEFGLRIKGTSYQEIAEKGGGIVSSINGVRNATVDELADVVLKRMDRFLKLGTTTIEAKSGYGLDLDSELKSLRVLDIVNKNHAIDIIPTFLGAHAFPQEYKNDHDGYVNLLCDNIIPAVAEQGIAKFCDVFCENGYFTVEQSRRILLTAKKHGITPRLHADEFEDSGAAELAAEIGAVSADHLMAISEDGIKKMAESKVTATLLPGTTFFLGMHDYAPARKLLESGIDIALATDFNPGSCHIQSMPFIISLASIYMKMSVEESFVAATYNSAKTLQKENEIGSIEVGKKADLVILGIDKLIEMPYNVTDIPIQMVIKNGNIINQ